jgi:ankyrin repeat protein
MTEPTEKKLSFDDAPPLIKAIDQDHDYNKVKQLLNEGANVNETFTKTTPLVYAILQLPSTPIILEAFLPGDNAFFPIFHPPSLEMIKLLIENGANVNTPFGDFGVTPLMLAVILQNYELVDLLVSKKADVNALDNSENSALMYAAMGVHMNGEIYASPYLKNVVDILIASGANVNLINKEGKSALDLCGKGRFYGARMGFDPIAKAIKAAGGKTAKELSMSGGRSRSRRQSTKKTRRSNKTHRKNKA